MIQGFHNFKIPEEIWQELERLRMFQQTLAGAAPLKTIEVTVSYEVKPVDSFKDK